MRREMIKTVIVCFLLGVVIFTGSTPDAEDEKTTSNCTNSTFD